MVDHHLNNITKLKEKIKSQNWQPSVFFGGIPQVGRPKKCLGLDVTNLIISIFKMAKKIP